MRIRLALALAVLLAGACGPQPPPTVPAPSLVGVEWEAVLIRGREPGIASPPTIVFQSPDRLEGTAGCNSYLATFRLRGGSLSVTDLFSTDMACHGPERDVESAFFLALRAAHTATLVGERLALTGPEGTIEFRVVRPGPRGRERTFDFPFTSGVPRGRIAWSARRPDGRARRSAGA